MCSPHFREKTKSKRFIDSLELLWLLPIVFSLYLPFEMNHGLSYEIREVHPEELLKRGRQCTENGGFHHRSMCLPKEKIQALLRDDCLFPLKFKALLFSLVKNPRNVMVGAWGNREQFETFIATLHETLHHNSMKVFKLQKARDFLEVESQLLQAISEGSTTCAILVLPNLKEIPPSFHPLFKSITDQNIVAGKPLTFQVMFICHFPWNKPIQEDDAFEASMAFEGFQHRVLHLINHISLS